MPRDGKFITKFLGVAIFLILEIASLCMLKSSSVLQNIWINRASFFIMGKLWGAGESVHSHFFLQQQNDALAMENFNLKTELEHYRMKEESGRKDSLQVNFGHEFSYLPAKVTKASRNSAHNYIILDRGSNDGVMPYSGIISDKGVVGIISSVGKNYSYGLTLMNANVSISSRIGRDGAVGPLVWDGRRSKGALFKDLPLHYEINPGDTVFTSGYSLLFPEGIPLGTTGSSHISDGSTNVTKVTLFQDFSLLRYVTIVYNPGREEILELEKAEGML